MNDPFSLRDKRVLVTGGTRGLGRAISLQFARAGATVIANYARDEAHAVSLQDAVRAEGLAIQTVRADITGTKGMETLVQAVVQAAPSLSSIVHCAATGVHRPFEELTMRHFDWTFALNVRALFELVQRLLPSIERNGTVLGITSHGSVRAVPHYTLVGSSKAALDSMLRHLAFELAPRGIRVNSLMPGSIMTDAWKALPDGQARIDDSVQRSAIKRLCTLEEVASAAQFLCSDASAGIVGQTLVIDGGAGISV